LITTSKYNHSIFPTDQFRPNTGKINSKQFVKRQSMNIPNEGSKHYLNSTISAYETE